MIAEDHVRRLPLQNERGYQFIQSNKVSRRNVNTCSWFHKDGFILPVCSGWAVVGFIEAAGILFTATIADKRGFIQQTAMVRSRNKVLAVRVAMIAGSAHPFANRGIGTTNIFLFAIFCQSTFVSRFIKTIVFLERPVLFDFLGDGGGIFS